MLKANANWVKNYKTDVDNGRGHSVGMDLPPYQMGDDTAASPLEFMIMGYAGCTITMFKLVTDKMRLNIESIDIETNAEKPEDIQTVLSMKSIITVKTTDPREKIQKALDRAREICPVGRIYEQAHIPADIELVIAT